MKGMITMLALASLSFTLPTHTASDFCQGWKDGYCEGWKDVKGQLAGCPYPAPCAWSPNIPDTYTSGYNQGFKKGRKDAK